MNSPSTNEVLELHWITVCKPQGWDWFDWIEHTWSCLCWTTRWRFAAVSPNERTRMLFFWLKPFHRVWMGASGQLVLIGLSLLLSVLWFTSRDVSAGCFQKSITLRAVAHMKSCPWRTNDLCAGFLLPLKVGRVDHFLSVITCGFMHELSNSWWRYQSC